MKQLKNLGAIVITIALFAACKKDDPKVNPGEDDKTNTYALVSRVTGSDGTTFNYYLQGMNNLAEKDHYGNSNATEILSAGMSGVFAFNGALFLNKYAPVSEIVKWEQNKDGSFSKTGSLNITELSYQSNIWFKDANTAYVAGPGIPKILIFNPTTMQKTGYIDFTAVSRLNEVTNFPVAGAKITMEAPTEMVIRDNMMYVGFMLVNDYANSTLATDKADMLIIDMSKVDNNSSSNSAAVVKWISSDKGSSLGAWNSGGGSRFMQVDENGDLYLICHNFWGNGKPITKKNSSVIRIKKGATDFDPDYYFDLEVPSIGNNYSVMNLEYAGNGKAFVAVIDPAAINPDDPYSYYMDPISRWYEIDLYEKTGKKVSDTYTKGSWASLIMFDAGKAYVPIVTKTENYYSETDLSTLSTKKLFSTEGAPMLFKMK